MGTNGLSDLTHYVLDSNQFRYRNSSEVPDADYSKHWRLRTQ